MQPKTPLDGVLKYLRERYQSFPRYDDPIAESKKSAEHLWYEHGWELIEHLRTKFFRCSSCWGNSWPFFICGVRSERRLYNVMCQFGNCAKWAECIVNQFHPDERDGRTERLSDDGWIPLPEDKRFYCHDHGYEVYYRHPYVPPTEEEMRWRRAQFMAMERMHEERPPQELELFNGVNATSLIMDESYLMRLAELTEEEHAKLKVASRPH